MEIPIAFPFRLLTAHRIGNAGEEGGEHLAEGVDLSPLQRTGSQGGPGLHRLRFRLQVVRRHHRQEAFPHLVVRVVELVKPQLPIVLLDSQIAALVNHRQRLLHIGPIVDELCRVEVAARQFVHVLSVMVEQADQVGRCTRLEPVVAHRRLLETTQQTVWIVDVRQPMAEMVAVVLLLQLFFHLVWRYA